MRQSLLMGSMRGGWLVGVLVLGACDDAPEVVDMDSAIRDVDSSDAPPAPESTEPDSAAPDSAAPDTSALDTPALDTSALDDVAPPIDLPPLDVGPPTPTDRDGDGSPSSEDCNDMDPMVRPGAPERCNGRDDNCNGMTDESTAVGAPTWYRDFDGDGYGSNAATRVQCAMPPGYVARGGDCNDTQAGAHPGGREVCGNGLDDDCAGGDAMCTDNDGDGYRSDVDCNDNAPFTHPGAVDLCEDTVDQDCSGTAAVCTCVKRLHVMVDDYGAVDEPTLSARSNGCWEVHSVNGSRPMEFRHCFYGVHDGYACGGHIRNVDGTNWYYDDTNDSHGSAELTYIRQCATRCGSGTAGMGSGFITMAGNGGWRAVDGGVTTSVQYIAQLYTSAAGQALQSSLFSAWASPRRYIPQISFTSASAAQISSWTTQVCDRLTNGNWMAFYVGSGRGSGLGNLQADDYLAWSRALNACTR